MILLMACKKVEALNMFGNFTNIKQEFTPEQVEVIYEAMDINANLRLSEQQSKHENEMKEFLDWTYKNGWQHSVTPDFFIRVEYPDIVKERVTFTELLTKFKNR